MSTLMKGDLRKRITIYRPDWYRGHTSFQSRLLRTTDGKMCCIGQAALQCGYNKQEIMDETYPSYIGWHNIKNSVIIARVNDDSLLEDKARETKLRKLFAQEGIKISFSDKRMKMKKLRE